MRQIKFRGWDIERKEWVYGYFIQFGERSFIIEPGRPGIPQQQIEVDPESVGQFIGLILLVNRNEYEVYDGDIVEFEKKNSNGAWVTKSGVVGYNIGNTGFSVDGMYPTMCIKKVIGNIRYTNPKRLKAKK